jgi:hypothetical protein
VTTGEGADSETKVSRLSRPTVIAAVATLLLFAVIAAFAFEPFVKSQAERRAKSRGLVAKIEEVDLGWGGVWLKGVEVSAPDAPSLSAHIEAVFVPLGSSPIEVSGGDVRLRGTLEQVGQELGRLGRGATPSAPAQSTDGGRDVKLRGLTLTWTGLRTGASPQRVWGIGYERSAGNEIVSADALHVSLGGASLEARGVAAELGRAPSGRVLRSLKAASADVSLDVARLFERGSPPSSAAQVLPASTQPEPAARTRVPLLLALVTSRLKGVLLEGARVDVPAVRAQLRLEGETLNFGPSRFSLERRADVLRSALEPREQSAGATPLSLKASLPLSGGEPELELEGGPVSLGALGIHDGDFGLFDVRRARVEAHTKLTLIGGERVRLSGNGSLSDVSLHRPALALGQLRGIRLGWRGSAEATLDGSVFDVSDAEVSVGEVTLRGSGQVERGAGFFRVKGEAGVPLAACAKLLESVPEGFAPELEGLGLEGTFAASLSVEADTRALDRMKVDLDVKNDCLVTRVPDSLSPARFQRPWTRVLKGPDGLPFTIESGPETASWVPYEEISRHMETAVIVCEDGGFYRHRGFDYGAIEKSIKDNVKARRFVRGASTISMQLAKNLYLGKEKTLSRKFEEAILTTLLEQHFSKRQLMELYLNVIEFGPGIYGIGPAARHYFDTTPSELSLGQALYLASILPAPDRQHFDRDGAVRPGWMKYLRKLMVIARKISRVNDEELTAALAEQVAFRVPGAAPPSLSSDDVEPEFPASNLE